MPDENDTAGWEESPEELSTDPLGIIGWDIGGKYKVRKYIGGGGFGEVYEGYNLNLSEQKLVFKFFKKVQSRGKFAKEAKILCMLDHPNISRVIDFLPEEGALVVAYIDGRDGAEVLKKSGEISEELFLKVARAMTSAVAYAHGKKIAHRDIKPANIMFDKSDNVYLIDFGIAKEIGGDATKTSYQALTPLFAAPERQSGETSYNPFLSDVYEMGVTLFNFATNNLPYRNPANPNPTEWGGKAADKFSPQLRKILMKATHPDPTQRYQSASDMAHEFDLLKSAYGGSGKKRSYVPYIALLALIIAGVIERDRIVGLYHNFFGSRQTQTTRIESPVDTTVTIATGIVSDSSGLAGDSLRSVDSLTLDSLTLAGYTSDSLKMDTAFVPGISTLPLDSTSVGGTTTGALVVKPDTTKTTPKPKPTNTKMSLTIKPEGVSSVLINDKEGSPDSAFVVKADVWNKIEVIHPDFPIYKKMVKPKGARQNFTIDMDEAFAINDTVSLQIALTPPSSDHMVDLAFNGKGKILSSFPSMDVIKLKGRWKLKAEIIDVSGKGGQPKIDSVVVFPYGDADIREVLKKTEGIIKLGTETGSNMESVPMLIYWSERN